MTGYSSLAAIRIGASPLARRESRHLGIALAALSLPWVSTSLWSVAVLLCAALGASLVLCAPRGIELGSSAARRNLRSALCLGCGVGLAFAWSASEPAAYCIAILVLALADGAAAFVGRRYGRALRTLGGARKSAAGSLAFLATAFAVTTGVLIAGAGLRLGEAFAAAALVATITTGLEASLGDGLDNLFVPLGALVALEFAAL